jgi:HD-GYP domain-containing protein (c-di-GMP phosphodiesterase class II)
VSVYAGPIAATHSGNPHIEKTGIAAVDIQVAAVLELARQDSELFVHGFGVGKLAERLALALGLTSSYATRIRLAGLLHDIGKLAVPRSVLSKAGALTSRERRVIERHPAIGAAVVQLAGLVDEASWIRHHHERMDGLGYPDRLVANEIPLPSRIILVADAFDALTSDRPYRPAQAPAEAFAEIAAHGGSQFDPCCVSALKRLLAGDPGTPIEPDY